MALGQSVVLDANDEVVVLLADGWTLRSGGTVFVSGEYVRLVTPQGAEYLYWDKQEWRDDPELVMGAILNAAAGFRPALAPAAGSDVPGV